MAICYVVSPLKHSVFDLLHVISHHVEDYIKINNETSIFKVHAHDTFENHLNASTPPLLNHTHTATGKVIPNHTHKVLAILDLIISTSDEQKEHQKAISKAEIDKHLCTSEFSLKPKDFNTASKKTWYTFLPYYIFELATISPPPQYNS